MLFFFFVGSTSGDALHALAGERHADRRRAILVLRARRRGRPDHLHGSWPAVGEWFAAMGPIGVVAWLLVPTALAAVAGYFILRRATPKS